MSNYTVPYVANTKFALKYHSMQACKALREQEESVTLKLAQMCQVRTQTWEAKAIHQHHPARLQFLFNFYDEIRYSGKYL